MSIVSRLKGKLKAAFRRKQKVARPVNVGVVAQELWARTYPVSNPAPARAGAIRAAKRLAANRKTHPADPFNKPASRQQLRWARRKGLIV